MDAAGTEARHRVVPIDLLRGAALFGILTINVWFFASRAVAAGGRLPAEGLERAAYDAVVFVFGMKSYLLFAFAFGTSFVLQQESARRAGRPFRVAMSRRLVGLIVVGALHALLLFPGDILMTYGILGFALLSMADLAPRDAWRRGVVLTVAGAALVGFLGLLAAAGPGTSAGSVDGAPGLSALLVEHARTLLPALATVLLVQGLPALGAMLAGSAAARAGLFDDPVLQARVWRRVFPVGTLLGLLGAAVLVWGIGTGAEGPLLISYAASLLTAPLLAASYAGLLIWWYRSQPQSPVLAALAAAGRMPLSNYLAQSLVLSLLFIGLSLTDRLAPIAVLALVVAIYLGQLAASSWWLHSHRRGPAEWLLRCWTLGVLPSGSRSRAR